MVDIILFFVLVAFIKLLFVSFNTMKFLDEMYEKENWEELRNKHKPADGRLFLKNWLHPLRWNYSQMFPKI